MPHTGGSGFKGPGGNLTTGVYKGLHLIVSGVVQGVGFRYYVFRIAQSFAINGWVRNRYDGSVEIYAEGEESSLQGFLEEIRIGPRHAHVADIKINWQEYKGEYKDFRIM
jgi:acylphosphatase